MKKKYLIIGSLAFFRFFAKAQTPVDTVSEELNKTEIELVYNHYTQSGSNSAVTGGIGTEKLTVYGPMLHLKKSFGKQALGLTLGSDIISSASTDKIDFVVSSASVLDARTYSEATYERRLPTHRLNVTGGARLSIESDYFSIGTRLGFSKQDKQQLRTFSAQLQYYNDDLRWGRLNLDELRPIKLIYPKELRYQAWYDTYRRKSYNLHLGFTQVLNKRNVAGIFPEITYQKGLLETPFHRIYFTDNSVAVEQFPDKRFKAALALKLNTFVAGNIILKNTASGYTDNFGIRAFSVENETAIKINPRFTLLPNVRFYAQQGSPYFAAYGEHVPNEVFYTSNYAFSTLQTYKAGIGLRYSPFQYLNQNRKFNRMVFRYNYLYRSNNLTAHIFSISFQTEFTKPRKKRQ